MSACSASLPAPLLVSTDDELLLARRQRSIHDRRYRLEKDGSHGREEQWEKRSELHWGGSSGGCLDVGIFLLDKIEVDAD